ncbi:MAG: PAS domain-containing protein [Planctomycetia bacterium]|nr:PAS domain-containing protein [Planctomycetia bacterium]
MHTHLRRYGLAFITVFVAAAVRCSLIPVLGYRYGFAFFLVSTFVSGRYIGLGPSVFAVLAGTIPAVVLHFIPPGQHFDSYFQIAMIVYLFLGAIVVVLCNSEHKVRLALQREIAERKVVEDFIRASEARLHGILDNTTALVYLKDLEGRHLVVNRRCEELFKMRFVGQTVHDLFPRDIAEQWEAHDRTVVQTGNPIQVEEKVPHDDGLHTYIVVKFPIKDINGSVVAVGGISTDITDHKKALDALEAEQELLRHTLEVQDHERQLIAYEIHDGLVQHATGALMQLEAMRDQVESAPIAEQIENVLGILQKTVAEGRRLINGIRTPVLDDWGVVAAVEQLIDDEDRAYVQIEFVKDEGMARMPPNIEEAIYRITQEALTNIRKHSQAKNVRIELVRRGDRVHLEVRDWGVGFIPSNGARNVHGLKGITERARIAGGRCTIESKPGEGTRLVVDLPYLGIS